MSVREGGPDVIDAPSERRDWPDADIASRLCRLGERQPICGTW